MCMPHRLLRSSIQLLNAQIFERFDTQMAIQQKIRSIAPLVRCYNRRFDKPDGAHRTYDLRIFLSDLVPGRIVLSATI